jgi:hypothetical protein
MGNSCLLLERRFTKPRKIFIPIRRKFHVLDADYSDGSDLANPYVIYFIPFR